MAGSTVNGNAGGASSQGATITCTPLNSQLAATQFAIADSSGNFSFTLAAGNYQLTADTRNIAFGGAYYGFVYRQIIPVVVDGTTTVSGINFAIPVNPNSVNVQY
jgi:hypothetical protein